jgi:hypothetical protein
VENNMSFARCAAGRESAGATDPWPYVHSVEEMKNPVPGFLENPKEGQSEADSDTLYYLAGNLKPREVFRD